MCGGGGGSRAGTLTFAGLDSLFVCLFFCCFVLLLLFFFKILNFPYILGVSRFCQQLLFHRYARFSRYFVMSFWGGVSL